MSDAVQWFVSGGGRMPMLCSGLFRTVGRVERAACRRYAIVVSPTQLVPEVLAVWGSDFKRRDSVS